MDARLSFAALDRSLIRVEGPDWRAFLQGLITQDVETMAAGEVRYGALLTPQGRLLYDFFVWTDASENQSGVTLDVDSDVRDALAARLAMYRLRAKVTVAPRPGGVFVLFPAPPGAEAPDSSWRPDPRLPELGWRAIGEAPPESRAEATTASDYEAHRMRLGVGDVARDGLSDKAYAVEANLDLLNGVDFRKGCFVGQETTSRMKRRGAVKTRLAPLKLDGPPPDRGAELLAGPLRAGEVVAAADGVALTLVRVDRAGGPLAVDGRATTLRPPHWLASTIAEIAASRAAGP